MNPLLLYVTWWGMFTGMTGIPHSAIRANQRAILRMQDSLICSARKAVLETEIALSLLD